MFCGASWCCQESRKKKWQRRRKLKNWSRPAMFLSVDWKVWPCLCLCLLKAAAPIRISGKTTRFAAWSWKIASWDVRPGTEFECCSVLLLDIVKIYQAPVAQTAQDFRKRLAITAEKLEDQRWVKSSHVFPTQLCSPACACVSLWQELKWRKNPKRLKKQEKKAAEAAKKKERIQETGKAGLLFPEKGQVI